MILMFLYLILKVASAVHGSTFYSKCQDWDFGIHATSLDMLLMHWRFMKKMVFIGGAVGGCWGLTALPFDGSYLEIGRQLLLPSLFFPLLFFFVLFRNWCVGVC